MELVFNVKDGELACADSYKIAEAAIRVLDVKKANCIKLIKIDEKNAYLSCKLTKIICNLLFLS